MKTASYYILNNKPYFGDEFFAQQGVIDRHMYFLPLLKYYKNKLNSREKIDILEIGSYAGASTISLADGCEKLGINYSILSIDMWKPYFDNSIDTDNIYQEMNRALEDDLILNLFLHNIKSSGFDENINYKRASSVDILPTLPKKSFDIIYIDGAHTYDVVSQDIINAKRLVKDGGIICGDDLEVLKKDISDIELHKKLLKENRDYSEITLIDGSKKKYHSGVSEAIDENFNNISLWNGFWAVEAVDKGIYKEIELDIDNLILPSHLKEFVNAYSTKNTQESENIIEPPKLIDSIHNYNIVFFNQKYIAVLQSLGEIDFTTENFFNMDLPPYSFQSTSLHNLKEKVIKELKSKENFNKKKVLFILTKDNYPNPEISVNIIPQGMPYIAGVLKHNGYDVYGMNLNYVEFESNVKEFLSQAIVKKIDEVKPDYIALGGLSADYLFIKDTIEIIKKAVPNIPIILGGGIVSSDPIDIFKLLKPTYGVILEGEITILELLGCIDSGGDISKVDGIIYLNEEKEIIQTKKREEIANLEEIPYPEYDIFEIEKFYKLANQKNMRNEGHTQLEPRFFVISSGRSCPFKCTFCYHSTGKKYKNRSIDDTIKELIYFHNKYEFNILKIYDELFSMNEERLLEFCEKVLELRRNKNIKFDWNCTVRVDQLKLSTLKKMKESGCTFVSFGFESASNPVLKSMKKGIKKSDILKAIEICEEVGIGIQANFVFGDPAETIETALETRQFFLDYCRDYIINNCVLLPFPDTPIWEHCTKNNIIYNKEYYYENIHTQLDLKSFINISKTKDRDLIMAVSDIMERRFEFYKSIEVDKFKINNKTNMVDIFGICPHCQKEIVCRFPVIQKEDKGIREEILAIEPAVHFCSKCSKKIIIPMLDIFSEIKSKLLDYINRVNSLCKEYVKVVIVPIVDKNFIEILEYYGLKFNELNIIKALASNHNLSDVKFFNYSLMNFSKDSIRTLSNSKFVIIPDNQQNIYKEELIKYGIDKNNIVSIEYQDYFNQPKFIESINNYNIVGYKENIFGIPQSLGSINLETADFNLLKDKVIVFNNLKDVESLKYKV